MIDQALWEKRHRTGIGGSDASAVLGVSPWKSRLGLWEEKVGEAPPKEVSERMIWGTRLEKAILQGYAEDNGVKVSYVGFRRHPEIPYVIGHPDGMTPDRLIEVKTADHLGEGWGSEGTEEVPENYWIQVQHYLFLTGRDLADLVLLLRGNTLRTFTIPHDREFTDSLISEEGIFWERHVVQGIPPEPDGSSDAGRVLGRMYPRKEGEIVATPEISLALQELLDLRIREKDLEKADVALVNRVKEYMKGNTRVVGDGVSASWSETAGRIGWKEVAGVYRKTIESMIGDGLVETGGVPIDESWPDTVEGLYRTAPGSMFTPRRKEGSKHGEV